MPFLTTPSLGATLNPGDLIVTDVGTPAIPVAPEVIDVDPTTGAQTVITSGGLLDQPVGVALNNSGQILVVNQVGGGPNHNAWVVSVDPTTGAQTAVTSGACSGVDSA